MATVVTADAQYRYATSGGTITITGYAGTGSVVVIPEDINGLPVSSIGKEAFYGLTNLTSVTIASNVTKIGDWAFYDCTGLTNLIIQSRTVKIGDWALHHCSSLTSFTIGTNVTRLGDWAYARAGTNLTVLHAPKQTHQPRGRGVQ